MCLQKTECCKFFFLSRKSSVFIDWFQFAQVNEQGFPSMEGLVSLYAGGSKDRGYVLATLQSVHNCLNKVQTKLLSTPQALARKCFVFKIHEYLVVIVCLFFFSRRRQKLWNSLWCIWMCFRTNRRILRWNTVKKYFNINCFFILFFISLILFSYKKLAYLITIFLENTFTSSLFNLHVYFFLLFLFL